MKNLNYRKSFEELLEYPLPPGVTILLDEHDTCVVRSPDAPQQAACLSEPTQCRAALMLIVDAMESRGWEMERDILRQLAIPPGPKLFRYRLSRSDECFLRVPFSDPDEVTALAECLIAALGP